MSTKYNSKLRRKKSTFTYVGVKEETTDNQFLYYFSLSSFQKKKHNNLRCSAWHTRIASSSLMIVPFQHPNLRVSAHTTVRTVKRTDLTLPGRPPYFIRSIPGATHSQPTRARHLRLVGTQVYAGLTKATRTHSRPRSFSMVGHDARLGYDRRPTLARSFCVRKKGNPSSLCRWLASSTPDERIGVAYCSGTRFNGHAKWKSVERNMKNVSISFISRQF